MLFLVEYDRAQGRLIGLQRFSDSQEAAANQARLELELGLSRGGVDREVVLLQAASEEDLRKTHRRYFLSVAELTVASETSHKNG